MFSKEGMKIGNHWAFFSLGNQVGGSAEVEMLINGASERPDQILEFFMHR